MFAAFFLLPLLILWACAITLLCELGSWLRVGWPRVPTLQQHGFWFCWTLGFGLFALFGVLTTCRPWSCIALALHIPWCAYHAREVLRSW